MENTLQFMYKSNFNSRLKIYKFSKISIIRKKYFASIFFTMCALCLKTDFQKKTHFSSTPTWPWCPQISGHRIFQDLSLRTPETTHLYTGSDGAIPKFYGWNQFSEAQTSQISSNFRRPWCRPFCDRRSGILLVDKTNPSLQATSRISCAFCEISSMAWVPTRSRSLIYSMNLKMSRVTCP